MRGRHQIEGRKSMEGPVYDAQKGLIARAVSDCGSVRSGEMISLRSFLCETHHDQTTTRRLQKLGTRVLGRDSVLVVLQCVRPGQLDTYDAWLWRKEKRGVAVQTDQSHQISSSLLQFEMSLASPTTPSQKGRCHQTTNGRALRTPLTVYQYICPLRGGVGTQ
jgi:hypothetical protein